MARLYVVVLLAMAFMFASVGAHEEAATGALEEKQWDQLDDNSVENCPYADTFFENSCPEGDTPMVKSYYCDGEIDCPNGEDEPQEGPNACKTHQCEATLQFNCTNNYGQCIPISSVCDGINNCKVDNDGDIPADESNCPEDNLQCVVDGGTEYEYGVFYGSRCDGTKDCPGGEDEKNCVLLTDKTGYECDEDLQFKCNDGKCLAKYKQCDCYYDCEGKEDELNCGVYPWPFPWTSKAT